MPLVVYKLGGSLLTLSDLDRRVTSLLQQSVPLAPQSAIGRSLDRAILVGGGQAADVVRTWDRRHKLGPERSHELALAAMGFNARLVRSLVSDSELVPRRVFRLVMIADGNDDFLRQVMMFEKIRADLGVVPANQLAFQGADFARAAHVGFRDRRQFLGKGIGDDDFAQVVEQSDQIIDPLIRNGS